MLESKISFPSLRDEAGQAKLLGTKTYSLPGCQLRAGFIYISVTGTKDHLRSGVILYLTFDIFEWYNVSRYPYKNDTLYVTLGSKN